MIKETCWAVGLFAAGFVSYGLGALIISALSWGRRCSSYSGSPPGSKVSEIAKGGLIDR